MARNKIAGITIEIGGNTQPLNKALTGVNKTSRDLQSELRQVDRLLKLDPKNTELLAQKQKLLTESVKNTSEKLNTLKETQKQVNEQFAKGEISEEQYRAFQREIVKTEEELKKLEGQLEQVNDKWKDTAERIGEFGDKSTELGKKLAPVSAAAGAVAGGMVTMAYKAGLAADDLNTLAATTGLSTATLQKFKFASDVIDVSMETLSGSLTKLTRSMGQAREGNKQLNEAFDKLGVSIKDKVTGQLRDSEDVFNDAINALGKISNETERDVLALQLFGRSAKELNPLILGGADALKQMGEEAEKAGLIMSQEALDSINEFNDEIDVLKATAGQTMLQLGVTIGEALLPVLKNLAAGLKNVMEWARGLDKGTLTLILTLTSIVAAVAPVLLILGSLASSISKLIALKATYVAWLGTSTLATKLWATVTAVATTVGKAFGAVLTFLTGPVGIAIVAITALITAGVLLYKNWEKIVEYAKKMWEGLKDIFTKIKDFVIGIWDGIVQGIKDRINKVIEFINGMIKALNKLQIKMPDFMGGKTIGFNIREIPMLASGGRITKDGYAVVGEAGPELLKLPQGAQVEPLGSGIGNVNVYVQADDLQQMADVVRLFNGIRQVARQGV